MQDCAKSDILVEINAENNYLMKLYSSANVLRIPKSTLIYKEMLNVRYCTYEYREIQTSTPEQYT
jgi:hypothetical protein